MMRSSLVMQALDVDKDGELSATEIANASQALKALDKNGDGKLSGDEIRPNFPGGDRGGPRVDNTEAVNRLMAFDKNGDGKLGVDELPERMRGILARADVDKDGFATKEELAKALAAQNAAQPGGGRGEHQDHDRRPSSQNQPSANAPQPK